MRTGLALLRRLPLVPALLAVIALQLGLLALLILQGPAPRVRTAFGGADIAISADRAWTNGPGHCATVRWDLEGIQSLYVNGEGKVGQDEMEFCPGPGAKNLVFAVTAATGESRNITFTINPDFAGALASWLAVAALLTPLFIGGYFLVTMRLAQPLARDPAALLSLLALLLGILLWQAARPATAAGILDQMERTFTSWSWHLLGSVLAGLIVLALGFNALRRGSWPGIRGDLAAAGAFLFMTLVFVWQGGIDSIGQWESWEFQAYFEGRDARAGGELLSRFWLRAPAALAMVISPDSFVGYHMVNGAMFWGMLLFFYAIMRRLRAPAWLAFLATVLFLVYPVNSKLMSLRSVSITLGKMALLAAVFLALDLRAKPDRLRLLGLWVMLLLNLGTSEYGLVLVLVCPLLWWARSWPSFNLTLIWYLAPVVKLAQVALLVVDARTIYGLRFFAEKRVDDFVSLERASAFLDSAAAAYLQTFVVGWQEALGALGQDGWLAPGAAILGLVGIVALYLSRDSNPAALPSNRRLTVGLIGGLLFILPSIAVLVLLGIYTGGLWRAYAYVPIGAAIAVMSLLALLSTALNDLRQRQLLITGLCLLLFLPGIARLSGRQRLYQQGADAKARVLRQIVEQAPSIDNGAHLMLYTTMSGEDLSARGIWQLEWSMLDSAVYMLYKGRGPKVAFLCKSDGSCSRDNIHKLVGNRRYLGADEDYRDVVMFQLHDDLRVELLQELPPELRERERYLYDPGRLIDPSAPLPPRARTMLAAVWRD